MYVNKFKSYLIIIRTVFVTLRDSFKILWWEFRKKENIRELINNLGFKWGTDLLRIVKVKYTVSSTHISAKEFSSGEAFMIMSNHASLYDIPLIFAAFPKASIRMMAKKELFRVPIWGKALARGEFISIDRENKRQAIVDLKHAKEMMQSGIIPWVAPEGTRSKTGELQPFKKGGFMLALQTGATIIPVGIKGSGKILPAKTVKFNVGENIEIRIGKPIKAADYGVKELPKLMYDVEISIKSLIK